MNRKHIRIRDVRRSLRTCEACEACEACAPAKPDSGGRDSGIVRAVTGAFFDSGVDVRGGGKRSPRPGTSVVYRLLSDPEVPFAGVRHAHTGNVQTWYDNLLWEMQQELLPPRRNRINPRVIKQKIRKWPKKQPHQRPAPKLSKTFEDSVLIH